MKKASGQCINFEKTSISFGPNSKEEDVEGVKEVMGVKEENGIHMYLGLPTPSLWQKRLQFGYIKERVQKRILVWNQFKEFSQGRKEVLIKAILQAIPTYAMQCFKLPNELCNDIHKLCASFWWGDKEEGRRMHWVKWRSVCRTKGDGGLGFHDMQKFNNALLAKQLWRLVTSPESLIARVFKARYCRNKEIMESSATTSCSYAGDPLLEA